MGFLDNAGLAHFWGKIKDSMQDKLTGTAGQVVGFDADGTATAVRGWSNPNLLDNWYFADPINQQRQTEYIGKRYSIDRWQVTWSTTLEIVEGGIVLSGVWSVSQRLEKGLSGTYTLSVLARRKTGADNIRLTFENYSTHAGFYSDMSKNLVEGDSWGLLSVTGLVNGANEANISFLGSGNNSMEILAVKLEQGGNQTLAHQDADGNWVLNDPPPDKTLELLKCQRYYYVSSSNMSFGANFGVAVSNEWMTCGIRFPVSMRCIPAIKINYLARWDTTAINENESAWAHSITNEGFTGIKLESGALQANNTYYITYTADANL